MKLSHALMEKDEESLWIDKVAVKCMTDMIIQSVVIKEQIILPTVPSFFFLLHIYNTTIIKMIIYIKFFNRRRIIIICLFALLFNSSLYALILLTKFFFPVNTYQICIYSQMIDLHLLLMPSFFLFLPVNMAVFTLIFQI